MKTNKTVTVGEPTRKPDGGRCMEMNLVIDSSVLHDLLAACRLVPSPPEDDSARMHGFARPSTRKQLEKIR